MQGRTLLLDDAPSVKSHQSPPRLGSPIPGTHALGIIFLFPFRLTFHLTFHLNLLSALTLFSVLTLGMIGPKLQRTIHEVQTISWSFLFGHAE